MAQAMLEDLDEPVDAVLAGFSAIDIAIARLEAEKLAGIADWCVEESHSRVAISLAGRERMIAYGGTGTPEVPEFALADLAAELRLSPHAAQSLVSDALTLRFRIPGVLHALSTGDVDAFRARMVASATRGLSLEHSRSIEARLLKRYNGRPMVSRLTRKRLRDIIDQLTLAECPSIEDEVAANLEQREVLTTPSLLGVADLHGTLSTADAARLEVRLDEVAGWMVELGDQRTKRELRAVAMGMLSDPGRVEALYAELVAHRTGAHDGASPTAAAGTDLLGPVATTVAPLPATVLYVHLDRTTDTWSIDGSGPISRSEAVELVGHARVSLRPVIDLAADLTYTSYAAPPRLREQLSLTNAGLCTFPYCDRPARSGDYDHVINYDAKAPPGTAGSTSTRNGHLPCRFHHRVKTFGGWTVTQPANGAWLWRSPAGTHYLVTAGTTTVLRD